LRGDSISVTWTPDVEDRQARTLVSLLEDIYTELRQHLGTPGQFDPLPEIKVFGSWMIPAAPQTAAYANTDWYLQHSLDPARRHVVASRYLEAVRLEPWQTSSPHFDLAMTGYDIVDDLSSTPAPERILGFAEPGLLSLVTYRPFQSIFNPAQRQSALQRTIAHYFGRLFGAPLAARTDAQAYHGVHYCRHVCALRHAESLEQVVILAQEENRTGQIFCEQCQKDLVSLLTTYHLGAN